MATPDLARDADFLRRVQDWVGQISQRACYHTLELPGGQTVPGIIPVESLRARLDGLHVPRNLTGKRVLDVGAASGWNSFEMEKRGAEVVAVDCVEYPELVVARTALQSRVDYRLLDVDEFSPETLGTFDYVLFLGVLYHLRHPLLGLEKICSVTGDVAFIESYVTDSADAPAGGCLLEFYEIDGLGGQIDNWFGPTTECLLALCRSAGFARVELQYSQGSRAGVLCYRRWEPPSERPSEPAPQLVHAVNNRTNANVFHPNRDEYICAYFRSAGAVTRESIRAEIDGYGVPALIVAQSKPGEWQANLRVPPGLSYGTHTLRIRTVASTFSNEVTLLVRSAADEVQESFEPGAQESDPPPVIFAHYNNVDHSTEFHGYRAEHLTCFVRTPVRNLTRRSVLVRAGEIDLAIESIIDLGNQEWQINAKIPNDLARGAHAVCVRTSNSRLGQPAYITKTAH